MELDTPPPSSQNPDSYISQQIPPAQPQAEPLIGQSPLPSQEAIFQNLSTYPFHADQDYLAGLASILGHPETFPTQAELETNQDLVLQAQCFYFARKANLPQPIDVEAFQTWLLSRSQPAQTNGTSPPAHSVSPPPRPHAPTPATAAAATTLSVQPHQQAPSPQLSTSPSQPVAEPTPPYPTSFADIVDLITQNKPIPGIEEIPDTVLELGSSKRDTAVRRKKPWEKDDEDETPSTGAEAAELDPLAARRAVDVDEHRATGDGIVKILQPGAIPGSGLVADE